MSRSYCTSLQDDKLNCQKEVLSCCVQWQTWLHELLQTGYTYPALGKSVMQQLFSSNLLLYPQLVRNGNYISNLCCCAL